MTGPEVCLNGSIIDSWVEPSGAIQDAARFVLQVAPRGRPRDLFVIEAEMSLLPDRTWLEDLSENLCHGSPVLAEGWLTLGGEIRATRIELVR